MVDPAGHRRRLAEVPREADRPHAGIPFAQRDQLLPGAVPAAIVHEDELPTVIRNLFTHAGELLVQLRDALCLVPRWRSPSSLASSPQRDPRRLAAPSPQAIEPRQSGQAQMRTARLRERCVRLGSADARTGAAARLLGWHEHDIRLAQHPIGHGVGPIKEAPYGEVPRPSTSAANA